MEKMMLPTMARDFDLLRRAHAHMREIEHEKTMENARPRINNSAVVKAGTRAARRNAQRGQRRV